MLDLVQRRGGRGVKVLQTAELNEEINDMEGTSGFLERCFSHITETVSTHLVFSLEV